MGVQRLGLVRQGTRPPRVEPLSGPARGPGERPVLRGQPPLPRPPPPDTPPPLSRTPRTLPVQVEPDDPSTHREDRPVDLQRGPGRRTPEREAGPLHTPLAARVEAVVAVVAEITGLPNTPYPATTESDRTALGRVRLTAPVGEGPDTVHRETPGNRTRVVDSETGEGGRQPRPKAQHA